MSYSFEASDVLVTFWVIAIVPPGNRSMLPWRKGSTIRVGGPEINAQNAGQVDLDGCAHNTRDGDSNNREYGEEAHGFCVGLRMRKLGNL